MTNKIIIIDLEATCWEGIPPQGEVSEIIEIGICLLDTLTGEISNNRGILVKPTHSKISPFCTQLTTITPELVAREGVSYEFSGTIVDIFKRKQKFKENREAFLSDIQQIVLPYLNESSEEND